MATIKLHRPGWTRHTWSPHGLFKPIRFDENDNATIDEDVYNEWIGDDMARSTGIVVTRPPKPTTKKAVKETAPKNRPAKPAKEKKK